MANMRRMIGAGLLALGAMLATACASTNRAPIVYGGTRLTTSSVVSSPPPVIAATPLDLVTTPFAEDDAPVIITDRPPSECVPFARNISGVAIWGDAVTWWAQAETKYARSGQPAEGSVLVLRGWNDDKRGHVAVVKTILSERVIRVDHANWMHNGEVSLNVPVIDVSEANDWSEVRVWHIPGGYWGGRTYQVQGFIHPYRFDSVASSK